MNTIIRNGIKKDLPSVLKLIKDLADYENAADQVTITLDDLEQDGFGTHPWYWFLVAEKDDEIIGIHSIILCSIKLTYTSFPSANIFLGIRSL